VPPSQLAWAEQGECRFGQRKRRTTLSQLCAERVTIWRRSWPSHWWQDDETGTRALAADKCQRGKAVCGEEGLGEEEGIVPFSPFPSDERGAHLGEPAGLFRVAFVRHDGLQDATGRERCR
jgi:hypothetical protein